MRLFVWNEAPDAKSWDWSLWTLLALDFALIYAVYGGLTGFCVAPEAFASLTGDCAFKAAYGCDCPGCGMTRATLALSRGELLGSVLYNPIPLALLFFAAWRVFVRACEACFGRTLRFKHSSLAAAAIILFLAAWLWGRLLLEALRLIRPV